MPNGGRQRVDPSTLRQAYVWDLDGTLADQSHRQHLAAEKRWDEYFQRCGDDKAILDNCRLLDVLSVQFGVDIIIVSGRSGTVRELTKVWLEENGIPYHELFMRQAGDRRPDWLIKEEIYNRDIKPYWNVIGVFDDRDRVVEMWRRNGLRCYQVAPGNF